MVSRPFPFFDLTGTARADFPGGDAHVLYRSIRRILVLPSETRLFTGHDYAPNGRRYAWESTVAEQRASNVHIHDGVTEEEFVAMRTARDAKLDMPKLILESKVGTMMPCNVVVRDEGNGQTEVAAIDPVASMQAIDNPELKRAAEQVRAKLERVVAAL